MNSATMTSPGLAGKTGCGPEAVGVSKGCVRVAAGVGVMPGVGGVSVGVGIGVGTGVRGMMVESGSVAVGVDSVSVC